MLIPAYFLVGSYGGERRIYAALKFVLFTSVGSLLMLAGIIGLSYYAKVASGSYTLDLDTLRTITTHIDPSVQIWLFLAFAIASLIGMAGPQTAGEPLFHGGDVDGGDGSGYRVCLGKWILIVDDHVL